jgi:hypothetical protein
MRRLRPVRRSRLGAFAGRAFLAMARLDLGALLLPSTESRQLFNQALTAADELGMTGLAKRAPTPLT